MFRSSGQSAFEVLSASDTSFKSMKATNRIFDKACKSYVLCLETPVSKLCLPSNENDNLRLASPYLLLQVLVPPKRNFSIELRISDSTGGKKRMMFSTTCREQTVNLLSARLSIEKVKRNIWLNLCINLLDYMNACFPNTSFRTLDKIEITSFCKLRKIVSLRNPIWTPNCFEGSELSKSLDFHIGVDYINQNLSPFSEDDVSLSDDKPNLGERLPMKTTLISLRDKEEPVRVEPRTASPQRARYASSVSPFQRHNNSAPSRRNVQNIKAKIANLSPVNKRANNTLRVSVRPGSRARTNTLPPIDLLDARLELAKDMKPDDNPLLRTITSFASSGDKDIPPNTMNLTLIPKHSRVCSETVNIYSKYENFQPDSPRSEIEEDLISEIIEASQNFEVTILDSPFVKKPEDPQLPKPSFYEDAMKTVTQHRPFTPPFRGIDSHYTSRQSLVPAESQTDGLLVL
jgi:hypothetical protein